jgi:hypothetical protein
MNRGYFNDYLLGGYLIEVLDKNEKQEYVV